MKTGVWSRTWVRAAYGLAGLLLVLIVNRWTAEHFWFRIYRVPSVSMQPTLQPGDYVLADMRQSETALLEAGDIIVFEAPNNEGSLLIKRVVGLPGQTVELRNGRLLVDGQVRTGAKPELGQADFHPESTGSKREYLITADLPSRLGENFGPEVVPPKHLFVLGDHRGRSLDSRLWGPITSEGIQGLARRVYFSRDPETGELKWRRWGQSLESPDH